MEPCHDGIPVAIHMGWQLKFYHQLSGYENTLAREFQVLFKGVPSLFKDGVKIIL